MKKHFKFPIGDAKTLMLAFTASFSTWAATGFQRDLPHLSYVLIGFLSGGLVSHEATHFEQTIPPDAHIVTPYAQNIVEKPTEHALVPNATTQGTDISKLIQVNSRIIT